jgi:hypothetical protein
LTDIPLFDLVKASYQIALGVEDPQSFSIFLCADPVGYYCYLSAVLHSDEYGHGVTPF